MTPAERTVVVLINEWRQLHDEVYRLRDENATLTAQNINLRRRLARHEKPAGHYLNFTK